MSSTGNTYNSDDSSVSSIDHVFDTAMRSIYEQTLKLGYNPSRFRQMVEQYGGVNTAKRLLATPEVQEGLMKLWELGELEISMEAIVLQDRFASLFTDEERSVAHSRLDELGFFK